MGVGWGEGKGRCGYAEGMLGEGGRCGGRVWRMRRGGGVDGGEGEGVCERRVNGLGLEGGGYGKRGWKGRG